MARGKAKASGAGRASRAARTPGKTATRKIATEVETKSYLHPTHTVPARPEIGTEPQFRKRKPPKAYRYDSSLSPTLEWDSQNSAREQGEAAIRTILDLDGAAISAALDLDTAKKAALDAIASAKASATALKRLGRPFLNWAGKAERLSFDVPTLPLFVHERLSTAAIIESLKGHKVGANTAQPDFFSLFGDPDRSIADQVLRAYEHPDRWTNRMILGDSLLVMNSLLEYEGLGDQVQMIYIDPPYGVKFGSNFQPFVRKRDVNHNDDADMTREPEMVQAYRDTWELGLHSYLAYLRDRLLLARNLLTKRGSIFVQISDENLHHVRELMDEVFGGENHVAVIPFRKKTMPLGAKHLESICDYILFYAKDIEQLKYRPLFERMSVEGDNHWNYVEFADGTRRKMTKEEVNNHGLLPKGAIPFQLVSLYPAGVNDTGLFGFPFRGKTYKPPAGNSWFTNREGMQRLSDASRIEPYTDGETLRYVLKLSDAPYTALTNLWADTSAPTDKSYVVQTSTKVMQRCMLMTTDPGDIVFDPTCGSGTAAFVAEHWGRRWITCDTSRVPLALARQRLLTATFPWYKLKDEKVGPSSGFVYVRKQNRRGEEVGGLSPYISKGSIASNEPPAEEVLVDRPELVSEIVRVTGPFTVEASIPTPMDLDGDGKADATTDHRSYVDRMLDVLRRSPLIRLDGGATVTLKNVRPPAKSLNLSAEAMVATTAVGKPTLTDAIESADERNKGLLSFTDKTIGIVFGPEDGAVGERLVQEAAREAYMKGYAHLFVIGFAIHPNARLLIEKCSAIVGVTADYVQMTPDVIMGDLLKTTRASQIFSVAGRPDATLRKASPERGGPPRFKVELHGVDAFDPITMMSASRRGDDVPAWMLDSDYNGRVFRATQVFFPRTAAWDALKRALKSTHEDSVWDHLAGTVSAPFEKGAHDEIAVKVIDDRGNELLVIKNFAEAR